MSIWLSPAEIQALPASGAAFGAVKKAADENWAAYDARLRASSYGHAPRVYAGALMAVRLGGSYQAKVEAALRALPGTEMGAKLGGQIPPLAIGRKLALYVIAADLIGFQDAGWRTWLAGLRTRTLSDGTSLAGQHRKRANNHGTCAGMSVIACDLFLADGSGLAERVKVFRGWLGDRASYAGFSFGDKCWQANLALPVGVNPKGAVKTGHSIDGVLPDDQRRAGCAWPPPPENYVRGALGHVLVTAVMLARSAAYPDVLSWSDAAAKRAVAWYVSVGDGKIGGKFDGDDAWQVPLIRRALDLTVAGGTAQVGKSMAFTAWTNA